MERLSDKCPCNMPDCSKGGQCDYGCERYAQWVADMRKSLAAYEDTGLEPSEIPTGLELENVFAAMQELKQYKDAEKQGLLVRLPCKAGDTVYTIEKQRNQTGSHDTFIERHKVIAFQFEGAPYPFMQITGKTRGRFIRIDAIGKLVFLTREAAESALAEMTDTANDWRE